MQMITTDRNIFRNYTVLAYEDKPIRTDIIDAIVNRIEYMTSRFSRVLFIRFDLHYPIDFIAPHDNSHLSKFLIALHAICHVKASPFNTSGYVNNPERNISTIT